jgi:hypothetical protein
MATKDRQAIEIDFSTRSTEMANRGNSVVSFSVNKRPPSGADITVGMLQSARFY